MDIERTLVLSTTHISEQTNNILREAHRDSNPLPFRYAEHKYGYIIFVPLVEEEHSNIEEKKDFSDVPEIEPIMDLAKREKCSFVILDADGQETIELETFEW